MFRFIPKQTVSRHSVTWVEFTGSRLWTQGKRYACKKQSFLVYCHPRSCFYGNPAKPRHICNYVPARYDWRPDDPEIVSDVLFALANVLSIARTTYLMPAFEVLGPLQIALGRMIGDITRFLVLFTLVRLMLVRRMYLVTCCVPILT